MNNSGIAISRVPTDNLRIRRRRRAHSDNFRTSEFSKALTGGLRLRLTSSVPVFQYCGMKSVRINKVMDVRNLNEAPAFITKDGSEIRELLAYRNSVIRHQSLAEARVPIGGSTQEHYHPKTEEIYYITAGTGKVRIEGETRDVGVGDAIAIPPGQKHKIWNTGQETLSFLCCCAPAYEHTDTIITEPPAA